MGCFVILNSTIHMTGICFLSKYLSMQMPAAVLFQLGGLAFAVIMIGSCHSFQMRLCEVRVEVQVPSCHVLRLCAGDSSHPAPPQPPGRNSLILVGL